MEGKVKKNWQRKGSFPRQDFKKLKTALATAPPLKGVR